MVQSRINSARGKRAVKVEYSVHNSFLEILAETAASFAILVEHVIWHITMDCGDVAYYCTVNKRVYYFLQCQMISQC